MALWDSGLEPISEHVFLHLLHKYPEQCGALDPTITSDAPETINNPWKPKVKKPCIQRQP